MRSSLFGYGKTTKALAKSGNWDIYDDKFLKISSDEFGNTLYPSSYFEPEKSDLQITSPGLKPDHPLIQKATNLMSDYDYLSDKFPFSIWVSGTNGKTTTTQMLYHLLSSKGALMGGNIGMPVASLDEKAKMWILETSSFTFYYTKRARPDIYVLLPISQDHLDWHGSFQEYEKCKIDVITRMKYNSIAIIPEKYKNIQTQANIITYKDENDLAKFLDICINDVNIKEPFLLDALLALCVEKILFSHVNIDKINTFKIDHFKIEEMKDSKNRLWVNDTKGTNLDATLAALKRYRKQKIHIILGGVEKNLDLNDFFEALQKFDLHIYTIGQMQARLSQMSQKYKIAYSKCDNLQNAVNCIDKVLKQGEVAMLSPASSSFDQFESYQQRGEFFVKYVDDLS